jgi:ketopantoate hydroxymethyltransferase
VKKYADLNQVLSEAAKEYVSDVQKGVFPAKDNEFDS